MEPALAPQLIFLQPRIARQSLQGYVRAHLGQIERLLFEGLTYPQINEALERAGFDARPWRSVEKAVFRARRKLGALQGTPGKAQFEAAVPSSATRPGPPPNRVLHPSLRPPKETKTSLSKELRDLTRPPGPGEKDPLA